MSPGFDNKDPVPIQDNVLPALKKSPAHNVLVLHQAIEITTP